MLLIAAAWQVVPTTCFLVSSWSFHGVVYYISAALAFVVVPLAGRAAHRSLGIFIVAVLLPCIALGILQLIFVLVMVAGW